MLAGRLKALSQSRTHELSLGESQVLGIGHAHCLSHCRGRTQLLQNAFPERPALHRHAKQLLSYQSMRVKFRHFIPRALPRSTVSLPQQAVGCAWHYRLSSAAQLGAGRGRGARVPQSPACMPPSAQSHPVMAALRGDPVPGAGLWQAPACLGTPGKGTAPSAMLLGHIASPSSCLPAKCLSLWKPKPVLSPTVCVVSAG